MAARKSARPGYALATIKIRAGALDIKHEGELPEEVAAAIIYSLLVHKSPDTAITGSTVLQSIDKAGDAARATGAKP